MKDIELRKEFPENFKIMFPEFDTVFSNKHVCWQYAPCSPKSLLPFSSAHSKLVKHGIAKSYMKSTLSKSCHHLVENSFTNQVLRLNLQRCKIFKISSFIQGFGRPDGENIKQKSSIIGIIQCMLEHLWFLHANQALKIMQVPHTV